MYYIIRFTKSGTVVSLQLYYIIALLYALKPAPQQIINTISLSVAKLKLYLSDAKLFVFLCKSVICLVANNMVIM